ncbi:uncharacterized protein LOC110907979 [Helianthus annuus]|uniref:uncharacterized protein LOC110907979 n=1 Tax=Helianthus annuus TaxID=4232 RepID=UPI000B8FCB43|nr:uncharacterized protein LOC110907979 [Helianthus annuus]
MEEFMNPFSEMYAFAGNGGDDSTNRTNENTPSTRKTLTEALSVESAYGTYNKPSKLLAIEDYNRWAKRFEEWLKAFAYPSWKSLKNGFNNGREDFENMSESEEIEYFVAEQKCLALINQSVREDIISLIDYSNAKDLWDKLQKKCIELARHGIVFTQEELVDKLFDSLPDEMDWQYFAMMIKNTIQPSVLTVDLLIEKLESHELEIRKTHKVNHSLYQQNVELYYPKSLMQKTGSLKTAFTAESSQPMTQETSHSGFHGGISSNNPSQGPSSSTSNQQQSAPKNVFQCNIAVDLKNGQNFSEESAKQQMIFLASNKSEPPRLKQIEEKDKEKSRALTVIHDDEGYDWSEILPEEDVVGYAFAAGKTVPFKDTRTEEEKFVNRRMKAQTKQYAEEEEARKRELWGEGEKKVEEKEEKVKSAEKKIDDGVIDTSHELTAENLMKMADKVLAAKELEVDSSFGTESNAKAAQHVQKEKSPSVDVLKEPEVKTKEVPVVVTEEKTDDEVEITGFRAASPKPAQQDIPESSHQKVEDFNFDFDNIGPVTGIFSEDMPEGESDMFNDQAVKELMKKVKELEKEKAKVEEERDMLKSQINDLIEAHNKIVAALVEKEKRMNQMKECRGKF